MLVPIWMGTNMVARNQQKHLSPSLLQKCEILIILSPEELINIKAILFLIHELFR